MQDYKSSEKPLVSVLMPCYNHEKYVAQAIESVLAQTYPNIELLVVDNGSTDESYKVIQRYEDRIKLFRLQENNLCRAGEILRTNCNGKYLALMTSDDYWTSDKIEKQVKILEENPRVKVCFTWVNLVNDEGERVVDNRSGVSSELFSQHNRSRCEWLERLLIGGNCLAYPSAVIEKNVYIKIMNSLPRIKQLSDLYMWLCVLQNNDICVVEEPLVYFRWHPEGFAHNTSAPTVAAIIRTNCEFAILLRKMIEDMDEETFVETFRKYLIRPNATGEFEVLCEKFFLLQMLANTRIELEQEVIDFYFWNSRYIQDKGYAFKNTLKEKYNYTESDFQEYYASHGFAYMSFVKDQERREKLSIMKSSVTLSNKAENLAMKYKEQANVLESQRLWLNVLADTVPKELLEKKTLSKVRKEVYMGLAENTKGQIRLILNYVEKIAQEIDSKNDEELQNDLEKMIENLCSLKVAFKGIWTSFLSFDVCINKEEWEAVVRKIENDEVDEEYFIDTVLPFLVNTHTVLVEYAGY